MYESGLNSQYTRPKRHGPLVGMVPVVTLRVSMPSGRRDRIGVCVFQSLYRRGGNAKNAKFMRKCEKCEMYVRGLNSPYIRPKRHGRFVGMVPVVTLRTSLSSGRKYRSGACVFQSLYRRWRNAKNAKFMQKMRKMRNVRERPKRTVYSA